MKYFQEFFIAGGPALWALFICTIILFWVTIEKALYFRRISGASPLFFPEILEGARISGCTRMAYLFLLGESANHGLAPEKRLSSREAFFKKTEMELSRGLSTLGTLSVISPFVGLLGTVLGIMHAFAQIASQGRMSPEVVGAGISEALVTTAAGLFVAILSVISYNSFKSLLERQLAELSILADSVDALPERRS